MCQALLSAVALPSLTDMSYAVLSCAMLCCDVQAILNASVDGHKHGVHSLMLIGQHLFSGDRAGTLKVRCRTANRACVRPARMLGMYAYMM